jgi:dihydrofolate synthase/folylpolyglutamate synthase
MLRDKDVASVIGTVAGRIDHWYLGSTPGSRGLSSTQLAALLREQCPKASARAFETIEEAFEEAQRSAEADDRILTFGSFLTVAAVMRARQHSGCERR